MAKHLTDRQKKKIIADYIECGNYSAVARKHKLSSNGVKKIVLKDKDSARKFEQKKEENTKDILEYIDKKKEDACEVINLILQEMKNTEKIERTGLQPLATSLGIIIDKFTAQAIHNNGEEGSVVIIDDIPDTSGTK